MFCRPTKDHRQHPSPHTLAPGANYSRMIDEKFKLNGRYRRAWSLPQSSPSPLSSRTPSDAWNPHPASLTSHPPPEFSPASLSPETPACTAGGSTPASSGTSGRYRTPTLTGFSFSRPSNVQLGPQSFSSEIFSERREWTAVGIRAPGIANMNRHGPAPLNFLRRPVDLA